MITGPLRCVAITRTLPVFFVLACCGNACAQEAPATPAPARPSYNILRFQEDWSFLRDPSLRQDWLDPIKFIPLGDSDSSPYLSVGGEVRLVYQRVLNDTWGRTPYPVNDFGLERYQLHLDAHLHERIRFFIQFQSGFERGRAGGPRPIDQKKLDFLNAFVDLKLFNLAKPLTVRVGRQELNFGSGRLVSVREGPNIRQGFYGVRLSKDFGRWSTDAFAVKPAADRNGFFDNVPVSATSFWGLFATRTWGAKRNQLIDVYYFGLDRKQARFDQGSARETRHTVGARIASLPPSMKTTRIAIPHYDVEAAYQFGSFGDAGIRAWTVATEAGYIFPQVRWTPRVGIRTDISSGDGNHTDRSLNTFNPLFPIGNYFGVLTDTGPGPVNFIDIHPDVKLFLPHSVTIEPDWVFQWRQNLNDGVYSVPGSLMVASGKSDARFVGHRPGVEVRWQINRHAYLQADYGVFFAGPFLRQSGYDRNLNFTWFAAGYKF